MLTYRIPHFVATWDRLRHLDRCGIHSLPSPKVWARYSSQILACFYVVVMAAVEMVRIGVNNRFGVADGCDR